MDWKYLQVNEIGRIQDSNLAISSSVKDGVMVTWMETPLNSSNQRQKEIKGVIVKQGMISAASLWGKIDIAASYKMEYAGDPAFTVYDSCVSLAAMTVSSEYSTPVDNHVCALIPRLYTDSEYTDRGKISRYNLEYAISRIKPSEFPPKSLLSGSTLMGLVFYEYYKRGDDASQNAAVDNSRMYFQSHPGRTSRTLKRDYYLSSMDLQDSIIPIGGFVSYGYGAYEKCVLGVGIAYNGNVNYLGTMGDPNSTAEKWYSPPGGSSTRTSVNWYWSLTFPPGFEIGKSKSLGFDGICIYPKPQDRYYVMASQIGGSYLALTRCYLDAPKENIFKQWNVWNPYWAAPLQDTSIIRKGWRYQARLPKVGNYLISLCLLTRNFDESENQIKIVAYEKVSKALYSANVKLPDRENLGLQIDWKPVEGFQPKGEVKKLKVLSYVFENALQTDIVAIDETGIYFCKV